jgi:formylglycine-generating enzyme required for sulfatase activity
MRLAFTKLVLSTVAAGLVGLAAVFPGRIDSTMPIEMRAIGEVNDRTILMSRYEVTRGQWKACVDDGVCANLPTPQKTADDTYPMTGISYFDAIGYIGWLNARTGETYRLPTAEEWRLAAKELPRPVKKKLFDDPRLDWASDYGAMPNVPRNLRESGSFGTFTNGVSDFGGNVWEWTGTCAVDGFTSETCPAFVVEGLHETKISVFIRDPATGGCAVGVPPAHLGLRLVRDSDNAGV